MGREKEGRSVNFQSRECDMLDGVTPWIKSNNVVINIRNGFRERSKLMGPTSTVYT